jgi:hypothetical protein
VAAYSSIGASTFNDFSSGSLKPLLIIIVSAAVCN